jgi:hypothetical protein
MKDIFFKFDKLGSNIADFKVGVLSSPEIPPPPKKKKRAYGPDLREFRTIHSVHTIFYSPIYYNLNGFVHF